MSRRTSRPCPSSRGTARIRSDKSTPQLCAPVTSRQCPDAGLGGRFGERTRRTGKADFALEGSREVDEHLLRAAKHRRIAHEQDKSHESLPEAIRLRAPSGVTSLDCIL